MYKLFTQPTVRTVFSVGLGSMLFIFAICGPFLLLLSQRCLSILSSLSYNAPLPICYGEVKLLQVHNNNCMKVLRVHSKNDKIVKYQTVQRTLPAHRILQEDRSAFNCARFIEIRLVIHESLKVAVLAFKVPTS